MSWLKSIGGSLAVVAILAVTGQQARSEEIPKEYRECIKKGLKYLVDTQNRDGHWESFGAGYPVTMTAVSGMVERHVLSVPSRSEPVPRRARLFGAFETRVTYEQHRHLDIETIRYRLYNPVSAG